MLQLHISAALYVDNAVYCKIEEGYRRAKRKRIPIVTKVLSKRARIIS